ncbi:hypothetical protein V9T40_011613 [Parthenolecanium corni]|uniref:Uncharacterized protein n=1 Tax=Parthenolecanium corni TaxID=536013 RepID=A0AAN9XYK5_9HEMI
MSRKFEIVLILLCASWAAAIKSGSSEHTDRRPLILGMDILPQEWTRNETLMSEFSPIMVTIAPLFGPQNKNVKTERGVSAVKNYSVVYDDTESISHIREESVDGVIRLKHVAKPQAPQKRSTSEAYPAQRAEQPEEADGSQEGKLEEPVMQNITETEVEKTKSEVKSWPMSQQPFVKRIFAQLADPLV